MPCGATQDRQVMVERSDRMWSTGEGNGKPLQYSCLENPMNSMKRQKGHWKRNSPEWQVPNMLWRSPTLGGGFLTASPPGKFTRTCDSLTFNRNNKMKLEGIHILSTFLKCQYQWILNYFVKLRWKFLNSYSLCLYLYHCGPVRNNGQTVHHRLPLEWC